MGKSTFINKVAKRKSAKAGDRPGVTRGKQWVSVDAGMDLLDTPGILWPKFDDETTGLHLAFTGAVRDEVMDSEELAASLLELLRDRYPESLEERYKVTVSPDTGRMARVLLDEFRAGKLGRFTLETPDDLNLGAEE